MSGGRGRVRSDGAFDEGRAMLTCYDVDVSVLVLVVWMIGMFGRDFHICRAPLYFL